LSYLCLEATKQVALPQPSLSVRLWEGTPEPFWRKIVDVSRKGLGMPALYNDKAIIPGMLKRGKTLEDARDYGIVGCVEPAVGGYEWSWAGGQGTQLYLNLPIVLEYAYNGGKSLMTGKQAGPKTGSLATFQTFEEVKEAYATQLQFFVDQMAVITNIVDVLHMKHCALPLLSCAMNDCVERGVDVACGGARYNATGTAGVGTANVGDSLAVIKKYVFDDKKLTGAQLLDILKDNWKGHEKLLSEMQNATQFYGNDIDEADELTKFGTDLYSHMTEKCVGPRGAFSPSLYPVSANVSMGTVVGASPDGRKAGTPLADGISPIHGHDVSGPTALLKSAAKLDHIVNTNGTLLNMRFHPSALQGTVGENALIAAMKTYFDLNGLHVQYNVVSTETLRDAQKNPEKYRDLVVRVAGYSALFVVLDPVLQEDIITRTEFAEIA
jgi:formate C-acetyltransferase